MSNGLILREDVNKEEFNILRLETENVSQFIVYYALLLSTACQYDLISQIEAEEISKMILQSFNEKFEADSKVMANNMYALTCYLQTMNNSKQIECLLNYSVEDLFDKANIWFRKELDNIEKMLLEIKAQTYNLKDDMIIKSFEELMGVVTECKSFSKIGTSCDFKKVHKRPVCICHYLSTKESFLEENYLISLSKTIKSFVTEVSILCKLNPSEIMKNLKSTNKRELNQIISRNEVQKSKLEKELQKAKEILAEEMEKAKKISANTIKMMEDLEREDRERFKKLNPSLIGDTFELAFANWQETLPEEHFDIFDECEDEFEIIEKAKQKYAETELKILNKLAALDKAADEDFVETQSVQTMNMTIDSAFKILAMIEAQKMNPNIRIPLNSQELSDILERLELPKAVQIVLATIKPNFSETELSYLKNV